jgi:hypothetical protein
LQKNGGSNHFSLFSFSLFLPSALELLLNLHFYRFFLIASEEEVKLPRTGILLIEQTGLDLRFNLELHSGILYPTPNAPEDPALVLLFDVQFLHPLIRPARMHGPAHNIGRGEGILEIHEIAFDQAKRIVNQGFQIL